MATKASRRAPSAAVVAPKPQRSTRWYYAAGIGAALVVVLMVYAPALHGPFLLDDSYMPYMLPGFVAAPLRAWISGLRPLLEFTFWIDYQISGRDTYSYHLVNVLLHALNAGFVYLIARKLLDWSGVKSWRMHIVALFAAALFLLHPLATESVSYVASRSETLSLSFVLAALTVFLYRKAQAISWPAALAVTALYACACLSKEHAVVFPVVLLVTDWFWNPGGIRRNWKLYVPLAIMAAAGGAYVVRVLATATTAGFNVRGVTWYQYFFTQCRAICEYLRLFIFPFGLNLDRDFPISRSILDYGAIVFLIVLAGITAAAWFYRKRFRLAA